MLDSMPKPVLAFKIDSIDCDTLCEPCRWNTFYQCVMTLYTGYAQIMLLLASLIGCHNTAIAQDDFDVSFDLMIR